MTSSVDPDLKFRRAWLLTGYLLVGLVIYLSVTSNPVNLDVAFPYQDKLSHMLAYFVLMAWFAQIYHERKKCYLYAVCFVALGLAMEYVQSLNPQRYAEIGDMIANILGVLSAVWLSRYNSFRNILKQIENQFI